MVFGMAFGYNVFTYTLYSGATGLLEWQETAT